MSGPAELCTGARWSEGPVWLHEDDSVLWSDIPNDRMLRWSARDGMSVWRERVEFRAAGHAAPGRERFEDGQGRGERHAPADQELNQFVDCGRLRIKGLEAPVRAHRVRRVARFSPGYEVAHCHEPVLEIVDAYLGGFAVGSGFGRAVLGPLLQQLDGGELDGFRHEFGMKIDRAERRVELAQLARPAEHAEEPD